MGGINAFDIESGVGFGVTELLRLMQHRIERMPFIAHFGQNEIGRTVNNAGNPLNTIGG